MILRKLRWIAYLLALAFTQDSLASDGDKNSCRTLLSQQVASFDLDLLDLLTRTEIQVKEDGSGFLVLPRGQKLTGITRRKILIPALRYGQRSWRRELWTHENKKYLFINVGYKNLEEDFTELHKRILEVLRDQALSRVREVVDVEFGPEVIRDVNLIKSLRWRLHDAVLEEYRDKKGYLTAEDFEILKNASKLSNNSDVFALLEYDPKISSWAQLAESKTSLLATTQVNYYSKRLTQVPTIRSLLYMLDAQLFRLDLGVMYPFEYRVKPDHRRQIRATLHSLLDIRTTCEIARRVNFVEGVPRAIMDKFTLSMFDSIIERGVKVTLANLDPFTSRQFRLYYGYQPLFDLPTNSRTKEFLSYLDFSWDRFAEVHARLARGSSGIQVLRF